MRHAIHVVWLVPFLTVAAFGADDLPQPKKDPSAPARMPELAAPRPVGNAAADADTADLQRLLGQLRSQREGLHQERTTTDRETASESAVLTGNEEEMARLRKKMQEVLAGRRPTSGDTRPATGGESPAPRPNEPAAGNGGPIDMTAVAQNLFRAGDYEAALEAYRRVPLQNAAAEERAPTVYMIATCYRKLGRLPEAEKHYRDAAEIKGDPFVAQCAQWQLDTITWRRQVEAQLAELREHRKALEVKP